ncbi:unnamed protein product [Brachionus calyciflorus]|uniref:Uncharacterized protein n=1 Tax=Brachionus calyciflorus TaxID=104777 RepID=A0A814CKH6_9BILA|nr:unnamed protein product [Brachionus calyciflorus]
MPSDPEKTYAKKHKINDLLNELYLELTKNKPDEPIQYAIKHLESKLPPKIEKEPSQLSFKVTEPNEIGKETLAKIFNKNLLGAGNDSESASRLNGSNVLSPFISFNIMNKINRIIVKTNKDLSPEEILEKENINYQREENEEAPQQANAVIRYKNDLKNRQMVSKHKNEIKQLVENQLFGTNKNDDLDDDENRNEASTKNYDEEELMGEILTADNYYFVKEKKKNKKQNKVRYTNDYLAKNPAAAPFIKFIICQFCSRIQNNLNETEDKKTVTSRDDEKNQSNLKEDVIEEQTEKAPDENTLENQQIEKTFFDFFKKNIDNLDDEVIESASQVSGPRRVEPFEAVTNRSGPPQIQDEEKNAQSDKDPGIMAWILSNQLKTLSKPTGSKSESTLVGSKVSNRKKEPSPTPPKLNSSRQNSVSSYITKKSNVSNTSLKSDKNADSSKQQWNPNSSTSNLSGYVNQ